MKKGLTELVFILDKSGSMQGLESDTIGGFNSMLTRQKEGADEALVSTVFFNDKSHVIHDREPIDKIRLLEKEDYVMGGSTALIDTVGGAIHHVKTIHKYIRKEDCPEKVMFVIMTDGMENASCHYNLGQVKKEIECLKKKRNWEFLFLGANIDAVETAKGFGIREETAVNFRCDSAGTRLNYEVLGDTVAYFVRRRRRRRVWTAAGKIELRTIIKREICKIGLRQLISMNFTQVKTLIVNCRSNN